MTAPQPNGTDLIKTIAACIAAPVVALVCAFLAGGLWGLMNSIMTIIRPEIIGFFAAIIGGIAGMYGARIFCDKYLSGYLPQAVFFSFSAIVLIFTYFYAVLNTFEWRYLGSYAQLIVITGLSYILFWRFERVD